MKKLMSVCTLIAISATTQASDLVISTGREGGTYFSVQGPKIVKFIKGAGLSGSFIPSTGSLDNLTKVSKGEAQIGIAQADAIMFFKRSQPQLGTKIEVGGALGEECVFVVSKKSSKINSDSDLQVKGITVAAGAPGDGSRATWDYMGILENGFKNPTTVDTGGASGLAQVVSGTADAFVFVTNPNKEALFSNELFTLSRDNKSLQFVPITDWDLNNNLPNGDAVYEFKSVITKEGLFNDKVKTICMHTYAVYNSDLDAETKEKLSRAFLRMSAVEEK